MRNMIPNRKEKGFTLIELVMVIVILGILAAFALPRFADFGSDAREASIKGAAGAVRSAASIAHARWLADGSTTVPEDTTLGTPASGGTITLDGAGNIAMSVKGYPTEGTDGGIRAAAQLSEEFVITDDLVSLDANASDDEAVAGCSFTYDDADGSVTFVAGGPSC